MPNRRLDEDSKFAKHFIIYLVLIGIICGMSTFAWAPFIPFSRDDHSFRQYTLFAVGISAFILTLGICSEFNVKGCENTKCNRENPTFVRVFTVWCAIGCLALLISAIILAVLIPQIQWPDVNTQIEDCAKSDWILNENGKNNTLEHGNENTLANLETRRKTCTDTFSGKDVRAICDIVFENNKDKVGKGRKASYFFKDDDKYCVRNWEFYTNILTVVLAFLLLVSYAIRQGLRRKSGGTSEGMENQIALS